MTIVYGLGFGMFLVLLVVPAFLVVQSEIGRAIAAFRRGLWRGPRGISRVLSAAVLGVFALTLGPVILTGQLADAITKFVPSLAEAPARTVGFLLFIITAAMLVLIGYGVGRVMQRKRATPR